MSTNADYNKYEIDLLRKDIKYLNDCIEDKEQEKDEINANFINKLRKIFMNMILVKAPLTTLFVAIIYTCNTEEFLNYGMIYLISLGFFGACSLKKLITLKLNNDINIAKIDKDIKDLETKLENKERDLSEDLDYQKELEQEQILSDNKLEEKIYNNAVNDDYYVLNDFINQIDNNINKPKTLSKTK